MPPRGNQPQERVCEANWRRSLCAAKRDPRLRGCTPLRIPIRKSEGVGAKRKQYYFSFLTPPPLPPLLSRGLRGCEPGATVERSETGERAMFAPAGQTTARAGLRSKLAALVVRRQAPPNPRRGKRQLCRGGIYAARSLPRQPVNGKGGGLPPSLAPLVRKFSQQSVGAGHARPAALLCHPFAFCIVGRGLDPSAASRRREPQKPLQPSLPLGLRGFAAQSTPNSTPTPPFPKTLQTLHALHKTCPLFAKPLPRLYRTMVETGAKPRYN